MRHAIRATIRPALTILLVVGALSCGPRSVKTELSPALVDAQGRPSFGYLRHRDELWDLRDWSWTVHEAGEGDKAVAHPILLPTIAGIGWVTVASPFVDAQVHMIGIDEQVNLFGFEDLEEDQCVEIVDIDGPILPGLRLVIPEYP